jgi:hypothetical protein
MHRKNKKDMKKPVLLDPESIGSLDPHSESGSRRVKVTHNRKMFRNVMF